MKGFASRSTVEEATAWVEAAVRVHNHRPAEIVELNEAFGRVLASDIVSPVDVPRFDRSMMDGYALAAAETQGATPYQQLCLRIVGSAFPGR
ncbi:MAG: molybdopterin molybdenumtransferase MoeA, partial [Planctomycetes bacterium]|nr:molybdopterin molybdenumtransferase MoeA [Planctomycetota bacterium]